MLCDYFVVISCFGLWEAWPLALLEMVIHFGVDRAKVHAINYFKPEMSFASMRFKIIYCTDQVLHIMYLVVMAGIINSINGGI